MSFVSDKMRLLAGTAAVVVFNSAVVPSALARGDIVAPHPLLGADGATYMFKLSKTLVETTGDVTASNRTGGFTKALEDKLRAGPLDRPQFLGYPNPAANGQLVISAVVPPRSKYATANIPVCAEQGDRIVGTYSITPKGDVVSDPWAGAQPTGAAAGFAFLCGPFIKARGQAMVIEPPVNAEMPIPPR